MKRVTGILAFFALTAAIFTGCQSKKDIEIDINTLADDLKSSITFADTLDEQSNAAFSSVYSIDEADIVTKKIYIGSGATAEEIAVFEAKDEAAAGRIRDAVDTHIADNLKSFEDYNPDELHKLSDPVIVESGKYVILCVSDDNETARKTIDKYKN
ncbi:MAG: DUF4358 domain-containing protein [Oscillospiraceae bacterium]|nr:DUF4358 domain-containing protein [Oscillospiraceae bacterium]MDD4414502.1 DUF4358 domain-containing protein [Oscillospiraceae bacterium]